MVGRYAAVSSSVTRNSCDDDCPLLCSEESPTDNGNNRNNFFRQRSSIAQVPGLTRLQSTISSNSLNADTPHLEERMRRRLQYFFMNPCQKYKAKKRKPYKLLLQIIKIALVTSQLCIFGQSNLNMVYFKHKNDNIMTMAFLRSNQSFITKSAVYNQINHILSEYAHWRNNTVGMLAYPNNEETAPPVNVCVTNYKVLRDDDRTLPFTVNGAHQTQCFLSQPWLEENCNYSNTCIPMRNSSCYELNFTILYNVVIHLNFSLIQVVVPSGYSSPSCFNTSVDIVFDNEKHTGELSPSLKSQYIMVDCLGDDEYESDGMKVFFNFFDGVIISTCFLSMLLCLRSLWKAQLLRKKFEVYFNAHHNKRLNLSEKMEFFNMWYLLIIISDVLTILGSLAKLVLQNQYEGIVDYNVCSIFLGVGCLCVWIGVLRYAGFFHKYNLLVLTLKKSMPNVCRFMVCASVLYLGFMFCGWVMLGPHHHKFRSLVVTSEALYSLINGDDMYMTYEEMSSESPLMVVVSQIYLYVFISLFIYVVLSLFIAVIMDTYETIKEAQEGVEPHRNEIEKFMSSCTADPCIDNFRFELNTPTHCHCWWCFGHDEDFYSDDE